MYSFSALFYVIDKKNRENKHYTIYFLFITLFMGREAIFKAFFYDNRMA